ncbi:hypothetical protein ACHAPT_000468 [Fusarium lateritium]
MDGTTPTAAQMGTFVAICVLLAPRLFRLVGNLIGNIAAPSIRGRVPSTYRQSFNNRDCSVIMPITDPESKDLECCIRSILQNNPMYLYIVGIGLEARDRLETRLKDIRPEFPKTQIGIGAVERASKRRQISHAAKSVETRITIVVDDNVHWPAGFLKAAMGPFENGLVTSITVPKCVQIAPSDLFWGTVWKRLANFHYAHLHVQNRAASAYDSSAILLGSTVLYRSYTLSQVVDDYETEHCFFGRIGALTADEHAFYNQYFLQHDDLLAVPFSPGATAEVALYTFSDFIADCERHIRSTWRISASMVTFRESYRYPWGLYATWLSELASFTLIWDVAIITMFFFTHFYAEDSLNLCWFLVALFGMKMLEALMTMCNMDFRFCTCIGIIPLLVFLIPCHYAYTLLKIKALLTYDRIERAEYQKLDMEQGRLQEPSWFFGEDLQVTEADEPQPQPRAWASFGIE